MGLQADSACLGSGVQMFSGATMGLLQNGLEQPRWHWLDTALWGQPASHQVIVPSGGGSRGTSSSSGDHMWGQNEGFLG